MPLDLTRLEAGQKAKSADVHQFGDLLLGVMVDQPVNLRHQLSVGGGAGGGAITPAQVPLTVQAVPTQTANLIEVKDSSGTLLAHFDPSGNLTTAGGVTLSAGTLSAPTAQIVSLGVSSGITVTGGTTALLDTNIGGAGLRLTAPVTGVTAGQVGLGNTNTIGSFVASTGVGTINFSDATARSNSGWWLVSVAGANYFVPLFAAS